jgi:hypothetical protein
MLEKSDLVVKLKPQSTTVDSEKEKNRKSLQFRFEKRLCWPSAISYR